VCTFLVSPLTDRLEIQEKTSLHRNVTLIIGFTISGLIHYAGTCNLRYSPNHENCLLFFLVQPLAIMLEDGVMAIGRRLGINESRELVPQTAIMPILISQGATKILGYSWMATWISFSVRYLILRAALEDLYPVTDPEWIGKVASYFSAF